MLSFDIGKRWIKNMQLAEFSIEECYIFVEHNWIVFFFSGYSNLLRTVDLPNHVVQQQLQQMQQKIDTLHKSIKPLPPEMPPSAFLTALADLDTANPYTLQDFLDAAQARFSANLPKCFAIWTHDGVQCFIKISDKAVHQDSSSAAIPPAKAGEFFFGISTYEAKSVLGGQSTTIDLDYGSPAENRDVLYLWSHPVETRQKSMGGWCHPSIMQSIGGWHTTRPVTN